MGDARIQFSELIFAYNKIRVNYTGATASTPGISNGNLSQSPAQAIDNDNNTKWFSGDITPVLPASFIVDFKSARNINMYTYVTGNDQSGRDPSSWIIYGSNDNTNWTTLDTQTNYNVSTVRRFKLQWFNLP
jgi:hypothetical protein